MTVTNWTRVSGTGIPRTNTLGAVTVAIGELVYTSSTPMTTGDQIGASTNHPDTAYQSTFSPALVIPAGSTVVAVDLDANQVDTSGSGAFNVGYAGQASAFLSAASVATATTNNRSINVAPTNSSGLTITGRGTYFASDTPIYITPSTNVSTVNVSGGVIKLSVRYTQDAPSGS